MKKNLLRLDLTLAQQHLCRALSKLHEEVRHDKIYFKHATQLLLLLLD